MSSIKRTKAVCEEDNMGAKGILYSFWFLSREDSKLTYYSNGQIPSGQHAFWLYGVRSDHWCVSKLLGKVLDRLKKWIGLGFKDLNSGQKVRCKMFLKNYFGEQALPKGTRKQDLEGVMQCGTASTAFLSQIDPWNWYWGWHLLRRLGSLFYPFW